MQVPRGWTEFLILAALFGIACGPPRTRPTSLSDSRNPPSPTSEEQPPAGVFHEVQPGQTLFTIARTYGVKLEAIVAANRIADPDRIDTGALLFIPNVQHILDVPATVLPESARRNRFRMPVDAPLNSPFGPRRGRMHYGVDLGAPAGTAVRAAGAGVVSYSGNGYRGYGNLIILDHDDGYQTLYAHNRRLVAKKGRRVRPGETIAHVGSTGKATAPHLHFEIRKDGRPVDPGRFLRF